MCWILLTGRVLVMHFNHHDCNYALNCDWLQYSVALDRTEPKLSCPPGHRIEICQGTNIYENRALVFDEHGRKLLTLLWKPYSSILNPLIMSVQVANEFLYSESILSSYELLKTICPCYFNSVGRLDICCDFNLDDKGVNMVKHLNSGHYYVERKGEGSAFWHEVTVNGHKHKQTHCLSWGAKTTDIKVKLYNKSRELGLLGGGEPEKPWIVNEWDQAGLDKMKTWRLEFSLKANGQLRWIDDQIRLTNIADRMWLAQVYCELYYNRFVTRVNQGKKKGHKNNDKRVYLIDLPKDFQKLVWASLNDKRSESTPAVKLLRSMMNQLDNESLKADKKLFEEFCTTIASVVSTHNLEDYFESHFGAGYIPFLADMCEHAGDGISEGAVSIDKLMN